MIRILFTVAVFNVILFGNLSAQINYEQNAKSYLFEHSAELNLDEALIDNLVISDQYETKHNGAYHLFFQQTMDGIPVFNAGLNVVVTKKGKILVTGDRLIRELTTMETRSNPVLSPEQAVNAAAYHLYPSMARHFDIAPIENEADHKFLFRSAEISDSDIAVKQMYVKNSTGKIKLCWNLELDAINNADFWNYNVDASSGEIVLRHNYTSYCDFDINSFSHKSHQCDNKSHDHNIVEKSGTRLTLSQGSYTVFPFPGESPNHVDYSLVENPADPEASPFGWHDTDGIEGPEFTITRGNNVHAYLDEFDQDAPSFPEPDGGEALEFHYTFDPDSEAENHKDAAVVNLFYANNRTHDLIYRFGFDEASGNFQTNNYGNGGFGNDHVNAQAFDGGGDNNANFSTPIDGSNGRMQMYLWSGGENLRLEIRDPLEIAGLFETGKADFGPDMDINTIEGEVKLAKDDTNNPNLGCGTMVNTDELNGNIALIDRGVCEFGSKVLHAEEAGAIAVLICNVEGVNGGTGEELITMSPGVEGDQVTIPSLFVKKSTCDLIKVAIANNNAVNITMGLQQLPGPSSRPGSFDNGVVIHEYTHGISTRLTGGPSNSSCLYNADVNGDGSPDGEQMGEGWSDFYALAFTSQAGDLGADARGIGTYASGQKVTGRGIRHYPYSTDLSISPVTYDFIKSTNIPHGVGEVWAAALWDMYWEFVNLYGFDETWSDPESGNYKALILVTDAMKIQVCNPGFLDGRDAVLDADEINYDGQHQCMIWDVFARRGMGYFAEQGDPFDHRDGTEDFEPLPTCIAELKVKEKANQLVEPGETFEVQVTATNHKTDSVTQVLIIEQLPAGLSYVPGSATVSVTEDNGTLSFDLGTLQQNDEMTISYTLQAEQGNYSIRNFYDDMEEDDGNWFGLNNVGDDTFWQWTEISANSGTGSWYVEESALESDLTLYMLYDPILIEGQAPALSFYHAFNTEELTDGGFVEYSTDDGNSWNQFGSEDFIMNTYTGPLSYSTIAIPGLEAFYGNSDGFIKSYIDLSSLKGESVLITFRYGTDDNTIVTGENPGWFVDDFEIIDLKKYERSVCIQSAEGDNTCQTSEILIDSRLPDSTTDLDPTVSNIVFGPNPAKDYTNVYINAIESGNLNLSIISLDGKLLYRGNYPISKGKQKIKLDTDRLSTGIYWLYVQNKGSARAYKLIIE